LNQMTFLYGTGGVTHACGMSGKFRSKRNVVMAALTWGAVLLWGMRPVMLAGTALEGAGGTLRNVIIVQVDDLGFGDFACYGNPTVRTPAVDRLAREGVRFMDAYAPSPLCSPSRAGLLIGRWPVRIGLTNAIGPAGKRWAEGRQLIEPPNPDRLPYEETTLAEVYEAAGYATASIGKWHLGGEDSMPHHHGFQVNFAGNDIGSQRSMFGPDYGIRLGPVPEGEYLTDRLQEEAEAFIRENAGRPVGAKPETIARYGERVEGPWGLLPEYAAMIEDFDASLGRMLEFLRETQLDDTTVVVLISDNGAVRQWGSNGLLRGAKGLIYEGGIRVPLIIRGPGVEAGLVSTEPVHAADLFPTLLELSGLEVPPHLELDGMSLRALLGGELASLPERPLYWHFPHYNMHGSRPAQAIRVGDWKLIHFFETDQIALYNLRSDIGESEDVSERMPEKVHAMREVLAEMGRTGGAILPVPNPDYAGMEPEPVPLLPFESTRTAPGADPNAP
jgi:arylsulfatase A